MKFPFKLITSVLILGFIFSFQTLYAQILKKLKKRAEKAAEEAVVRKTEEKVYKETSKTMDTILGNDGKTKGKKPTNTSGNKNPNGTNNKNPNSNSESPEHNSTNEIKIYSKFDFVPGDKLLFFDDYSNDFVGDFPSKWNTNGSGEVVTVNDAKQKWMQLLSGYTTYYIPDVVLPEEYTIEFDLLTAGLDNKTSSQAKLNIYISDDDKFNHGRNHISASLPFGQYADFFGIRVKNFISSGGGDINNVIKADIRKAVLNKPHISIAVNKLRFRLWVNEKKYVDIPRLMPPGAITNTLKFNITSFKDGKERLFISNLKVAEGGVDLRRQLIEKGKFSTNGILFDSGSDKIQPQSYGIIRQISQAMQQVSDMKLTIIGHTDSEGADDANLDLSKKRAESVKKALISIYDISKDRLETDGKGESVPVGDNNTADGKAQNRRVEFVKI